MAPTEEDQEEEPARYKIPLRVQLYEREKEKWEQEEAQWPQQDQGGEIGLISDYTGVCRHSLRQLGSIAARTHRGGG